MRSSTESLVTAAGLRHDAQMDYETAQLRLPPHVDRVTAAVQLAIAAEYSGWELARVQLFGDGTRKVLLRRRRSVPALPRSLLLSRDQSSGLVRAPVRAGGS